MAKYDTFNPDIENGYDPEDSLTYPDIESSRPSRVSSRTTSNFPRGAKSSGKKTVTSRSTKRSIPKTPSIPLRKRINDFMSDPRTRAVLGLIMLALGAYLAIAFISYIFTGLHDQSEAQNVANGAAKEIENMAGEGGARLSDILINQSFGLASIVIILWLLGMAFKFFGLLRFKVVNFTIKCLVALVTTSLIIGLATIAMDTHFLWGGAHGYIINQNIIHYVGWIGALLLCVILVAIFFSICLYDIYRYFKRLAGQRKKERDENEEKIRKREELERKIAELQALEDEKTDDDLPVEKVDTENKEMVFDNVSDPSEDGHAGIPDTSISNGTGDNAGALNNPDLANGVMKDVRANRQLDDALSEDGDSINTDDGADTDDNGEPVKIETTTGVMTVTTNKIGKAVADDDTPDVFDPTATLSNYKFPPYSLLRESESRISVDQNEQLENQERIRATLADFGIEITDIKATVGPTVTLYEIRPDKGVKISKIRSLGDDIALSLAAVGVRIIAPIPGRGTVGIEVANKDPQTVSMRTIITSRAYQECKYELPIAIGSTINNRVYLADLTKMPHLLVAGATGQGKSVGLNAIIASLLYRKHPAELKFVLVDPKMVEFSLYQALEKHYLAQLPGEEEAVITRPEKVVATLSSLCVEMDARYDLLKAAEVRNIKEYNAKFIARRLNPDKGHRYMPYIVVVVDEFADLIMTAGKEVETPIARLAQKARAIGIHVILATQRPSANVITGVIKANFPARIAFKVASGIDSRTVLDSTGAEHLIGRGDMLISNNSEMERVQCAFIDTPEVTAICQHIKKQQSYGTPYLLPEPLAVGDMDGGGAGGGEFGDRDQLFDEIARLIVTSNTASTSSLQRRYSIGYNRAGKIMDQMEAAGIVGPAVGGKPRQVLVDSITLESILSSL